MQAGRAGEIEHENELLREAVWSLKREGVVEGQRGSAGAPEDPGVLVRSEWFPSYLLEVADARSSKTFARSVPKLLGGARPVDAVRLFAVLPWRDLSDQTLHLGEEACGEKWEKVLADHPPPTARGGHVLQRAPERACGTLPESFEVVAAPAPRYRAEFREGGIDGQGKHSLRTLPLKPAPCAPRKSQR